MKNKNAFTLIELLVLIGLIAVVFVIITPVIKYVFGGSHSGCGTTHYTPPPAPTAPSAPPSAPVEVSPEK